MTTIAFKDGVLAADRLMSRNWIRFAFMPKIMAHRGWALATVGDVAALATAIRAFDPSEDGFGIPALPDHSEIIAAAPDRLVIFEGAGHFDLDPGGVYGWGTGGDVALGAMLAGKSAPEAVAIAATVDTASGGDVDAIDVAALARARRQPQPVKGMFTNIPQDVTAHLAEFLKSGAATPSAAMTEAFDDR